MECPNGHEVAYTMDSSAWGGPLLDQGPARLLRTYFPCMCEEEPDGPIPFVPIPLPTPKL